MPKTFLKKSGGWTEMKSIFLKKTTGWAEIRKVFLKKASGWVLVFQKLSLPDTTTSPSIRTTNTSGTGGTYDGPVATSPQYLNEDLFGKDGVYTNYTSIYGRKFTYGDTTDSTSRTTIVSGDLLTSSTVTGTQRLTLDEKYLFYELTVQNGSASNEIYPVSAPIKMIKQWPYSNSFTITGAAESGITVTANLDIEYYYYSRPELGSSTIKWYVGNYTGDTSGGAVQTTTLSSAQTSLTSSQYIGADSFYIDPSYLGKYITAVIYGENSGTRNSGYATGTYGMDYAYLGPVSGALSFSNFQILDYNDNDGLDNRSDFPVGASQQIKGTFSGVDSTTTYRIRYRVYNWQNGSYYNLITGATGTASSVWTTYSADSTGSGTISSVNISGTTAYVTDYLTVDETIFDGGTYSGGQYKWQIEIELSAIKSGGTRVYWINPYDSYYLTRSANSTISLSSSTISPGSSVTISGAFSGYPAGAAYPKQYKVDYGDGTNSGWLPSGGYSYGTSNPSYSVSHTYSTAGTYYPNIETIPYYTVNATTLSVADIATAPTSVSVSPSQTYFDISWSGSTNATKYRIFWGSLATNGSDPAISYDYETTSTSWRWGTSNPDRNGVTPSTGNAYYFWVSASNSSNVWSAWTRSSTSYSLTIPNATAPTSVTTSVSGNVVTVNWSGATNAAKYRVYWTSASSTSADPAVSYDAETTSTSTSFTLSYGSTYYFYVSASNTNNIWTAYNSARSALTTTGAANATAPTSVTTSVSGNQVTVNWSGATGATNYRIYWVNATSTTADPAVSYDGQTTSTSYTFTLSYSSQYYFFVSATSGNGYWTPYNSARSALTTTGSQSATAPTSVSASTVSSSSISVSWSGATNASTYRIWWSTSSTGYASDPSTSYDAQTTSTSYTFTGLSSSTTYYFWVSATSGNGTWTPYSSSPRGSATTSASVSIPGTPTGVGLTGSGSVSWTAVSGATSYEIQFYTASNGSGSNAAGPYSVTGISSSPYQLTSPYGGTNANWARVQVRARNSAGASSYSGWVPSATTYT